MKYISCYRNEEKRAQLLNSINICCHKSHFKFFCWQSIFILLYKRFIDVCMLTHSTWFLRKVSNHQSSHVCVLQRAQKKQLDYPGMRIVDFTFGNLGMRDHGLTKTRTTANKQNNLVNITERTRIYVRLRSVFSKAFFRIIWVLFAIAHSTIATNFSTKTLTIPPNGTENIPVIYSGMPSGT